MKTNFLPFFLLLLFAVLLQTTVFSHLEVYGVAPNLALVVVILASLSVAWRPALILALLGGLLLDFFSAGQFGVFALTFIIIGFLFSFLKSYLFTQTNVFVYLVAVLAGTIFYYFIAMFLAGFFSWLKSSALVVPWRENLFFTLPLELAYNLAFAVIIFLGFSCGRSGSAGPSLSQGRIKRNL